jgi:diguanylate cyclase (GGDEF)-like protein
VVSRSHSDKAGGEGSGPPEGHRGHAAEQRAHAAEERDQSGEQRDHAGDRRDFAGGVRDEAAEQRDQAGDARDEAAGERDRAADERDQAGGERDEAAAQRDQAAEQSEARASAGITNDALNRSALARRDAAADRRGASQDRRAGAAERAQAEVDRNTARTDRRAGASERYQAGLDRDTALTDRGASARERANSSVDELTGAYLRGTGVMEIEREIARARRSERPLALAFVDVDHLKVVNDSRGHAAGDRLLVDVANSFREKLRSHDVIIRYGGDEFVCVLPGLDMAEARERLALISATLAEAPEHGSVTVGLAQLQRDDSPEDLVARADAELYRERQRGVPPGGLESRTRRFGRADRRRSPGLGHSPERRVAARRVRE